MSGFDFTKYKDTQFYAGKPDKASKDRLSWKDIYYELDVCEEDGNLVAIMNSGYCEWRTPISPSPENFVLDVDAALEDACFLGGINDIPDPEF